MFYKIQLDLVLTSFDIHPDQVSEILSISPTRTWMKDEPIQKTALKRKTNGWLLSSGLDQRAELVDHMNAISSKIKPAIGNFANLPTSTHKELSCAIRIYSNGTPEEEHRTPPIHLEPEHVKFLNELGAEFDLDLYILPE